MALLADKRKSYVVMGVSGCGKSTLGKALAHRLGVPYVEGDELHPPENIAKMAAGIPLNDEDRLPFLDAVACRIQAMGGEGVVVSCSALKRSYRDRIGARAPSSVCFVMPELSKEQLEVRMRSREGHFMPTSLLDSQLAILERPTADEDFIAVDGMADVGRQVDQILAG